MIKKLNVGERLILLGILPKEGNLVTLRAARDMVSKVGLSAEDLKKYGVKQHENGLTQWSEEGLKGVDIDFESFESELIISILKKMDEDKKLTSQHLPLYEKFVENK